MRAPKRWRTKLRHRSRETLASFLPSVVILAGLVSLTALVFGRVHPLLSSQQYGEILGRTRATYAARYVVSDEGAVFFPIGVRDPQIADWYFDHSQTSGKFANPYCGLNETYKYMAWSPMDVRKATVDYFRENVQLVIITGNYDNYSRVEAARCTWLAHVPQENILFATDRLHVPGSGWGADGPHDIYRFGNWHANEDTEASGAGSGRRRALDAEQFQFALQHWGHPVAWVTAQMRFFDGLRFAYEDQRKAWASMTDKSRFKHSRWIALLDDDSYVHLDAMASTLMYHDTVDLLTHDDYWWRHLWSTHMSSRVVMDRGKRHWAEVLHTRKASDWVIHCDILQKRHDREPNRFLQLPFFRGSCLTLPMRISKLFVTFLEARGLSNNESVTSLFKDSERRADIFEQFARTTSHSIFFLNNQTSDVEDSVASVFQTLWYSMNEILSETWVRLYLLRPVRIPELTLAGSGTFLNTVAFYHRFMRESPAPTGANSSSREPAVTYAYETCCLPYLFGGRASDEAIQSCARELGIRLQDESRLRDKSLQDYIRDGTALLDHNMVGRGVSSVKDQVEKAANRDLATYAIMHVKMEFFDTMRHRSGRGKDRPPLSRAELKALYRLAHFRMRLYYEGVYQYNRLSLLLFKQLGAQVRNEVVETNETLRHVRNAFTAVFLPALINGKV